VAHLGGGGSHLLGYVRGHTCQQETILQASNQLQPSSKPKITEYIWIDTCCINKTISAELSEAINSMSRRYQEAEVCYAYLAGVSNYSGANSKSKKESKIWQTLWFTRGWTLQALIAPKALVFYSMF
jgi:hypothetical protein